ncbi:MAG: hypothetical protein U9Q97_02695 [Acidobacteriota bacterium]|nr:hypothetical protein [Acidobacteriota bacterium]
MTKQYKYGSKKEDKVAQALRSRGAKVKKSPGSKGAADLKATFPTGTKWYVQVKSSRKGTPSSPSKKDLSRLKQSATRSRATGVIAKVSQGGIEYSSARTSRKLKPPPRRRK